MITYKDLLSNTIDKKINESNFQSAYDSHDLEAMWWSVFYACSAVCKNIYKSRGVIIEDEELYGTIIDSTSYCMEFIKNRGVRPQKLSSYVYLRCIKFIDNPKRKFHDICELPFLYDKEGRQIEPEDVRNYYTYNGEDDE